MMVVLLLVMLFLVLMTIFIRARRLNVKDHSMTLSFYRYMKGKLKRYERGELWNFSAKLRPFRLGGGYFKLHLLETARGLKLCVPFHLFGLNGDNFLQMVTVEIEE